MVVPVYKVEDVLSRCLDSLRRQSLQDIEIILVDDGSPDNCPMICDEWSRRDSRIIVIHRKNGGLSAARKKGINITHKSCHGSLIDCTIFARILIEKKY